MLLLNKSELQDIIVEMTSIINDKMSETTLYNYCIEIVTSLQKPLVLHSELINVIRRFNELSHCDFISEEDILSVKTHYQLLCNNKIEMCNFKDTNTKKRLDVKTVIKELLSQSTPINSFEMIVDKNVDQSIFYEWLISQLITHDKISIINLDEILNEEFKTKDLYLHIDTDDEHIRKISMDLIINKLIMTNLIVHKCSNLQELYNFIKENMNLFTKMKSTLKDRVQAYTDSKSLVSYLENSLSPKILTICNQEKSSSGKNRINLNYSQIVVDQLKSIQETLEKNNSKLVIEKKSKIILLSIIKRNINESDDIFHNSYERNTLEH